jgi:hypothetical protein
MWTRTWETAQQMLNTNTAVSTKYCVLYERYKAYPSEPPASTCVPSQVHATLNTRPAHTPTRGNKSPSQYHSKQSNSLMMEFPELSID